jgi:V/A-type H+-transporting ATPase subunit I
MKHVRATDLIWEAVAHDNQFAYVVVISREEPKGMPVERIRTGSRRLRDLEQRLEEVEVELEDLQAVRAALTRWCRLFARSIYQLEDEAALMAASRETFDDEGLFALQAWAPVSELEHIRRYCAETGLVLESADPRPEETPPTLLRNRPALSGGQNLVQFYMTPNYWLWDPSTIVFFSFALFFAMILSDAGYAVLLGAVLLLAWKRMGRSDGGRRLRILFASVAAVSAVWGVLVGSYFGVSPASGGILSDFKLWNLNDYDAMMRLSVLIGVSHLVLANLLDAKRRAPSLEALAPLGWVTALAGAVFLAEGAAGQNGPGAGGPVAQVGMGLLAGGLLLVVLFTSTKRPFWKRLISGLLGLTKVSGAFGDVLSYLRLFALGLASASLAVAFNDLAGQVYDAVPGFKVLFASLVVLIGHGLNLALAVMSGFIHGLRLNFIEFFNWSISEEGRPFRPFARKEAPAWNP